MHIDSAPIRTMDFFFFNTDNESGVAKLFREIQGTVGKLRSVTNSNITVMVDDMSLLEIAATNSNSDHVLDFLHYCHTLTSESVSIILLYSINPLVKLLSSLNNFFSLPTELFVGHSQSRRYILEHGETCVFATDGMPCGYCDKSRAFSLRFSK